MRRTIMLGCIICQTLTRSSRRCTGHDRPNHVRLSEPHFRGVIRVLSDRGERSVEPTHRAGFTSLSLQAADQSPALPRQSSAVADVVRMSYVFNMADRAKGKILTVRISAPLERRLRSQAKARGVTPSEVVRGLLEAELLATGDEGVSLYERGKSLIGSLNDPRLPAGRASKRALQEWRPDRRG